MRTRAFELLLIVAACFVTVAAQEKVPTPMPTEIYLGRYSFIDIGPPFDSYEVISLRSTADGVQIERATVTPPGDACFNNGSVTYSSTEVKELMAQLLGNVNPCSIPQRDLAKEEKRCKHCLVFSGSDVIMQAACSAGTRNIRMDILDRDMFDPHAGTPKNTSWTMGLMSRLDNALGSDNIMDKPIFQTNAPPEKSPPASGQKLVGDIEAGDFDTLFPPGADKISVVARKTKVKPVPPSVSVIGDIVPKPSSLALPLYPPIARAAHAEGLVKAAFTISSEGGVSDVKILDGPPMLRLGVENAVKQWKFEGDQSGKVVEAAFQFKLNCSPAPHP